MLKKPKEQKKSPLNLYSTSADDISSVKAWGRPAYFTRSECSVTDQTIGPTLDCAYQQVGIFNVVSKRNQRKFSYMQHRIDICSRGMSARPKVTFGSRIIKWAYRFLLVFIFIITVFSFTLLLVSWFYQSTDIVHTVL